MKLKEYLDHNGIYAARFARSIGMCTTTFHNILKGHQDIRLSTAIRIEKATHGKVTCQELADDIRIVKNHNAGKKKTIDGKKMQVAKTMYSNF